MRKNFGTLEDSVWQDAVCCELLSGCIHQVQRPVVCQAVACKLVDTGKILKGIHTIAPLCLYMSLPCACHTSYSVVEQLLFKKTTLCTMHVLDRSLLAMQEDFWRWLKE